MQDRQLKIKIKGHKVEVEAFGFQGESCEKVVDRLDEMMAQVEREAKPERWEQDVQTNQLH